MTGTMGTAAADMARVLQAVPMASTIVAFENLIQRLTNQDSVAYSPTGRRVEGGDGRISGYDNMTFAQKRAAQDRPETTEVAAWPSKTDRKMLRVQLFDRSRKHAYCCRIAAV